MDEMIDINGYRNNGILNNGLFSTCPILPKFHLTYGEPIERQEVSYEYEISKDTDPRKQHAHNLLGRIDKIKVEEKSGLPLVIDDFGVNVIYDAALVDMEALEGELLKIMSLYINKVEPIYTDTDLPTVFPTVDRFAMLQDLLMCEEDYQTAKLDVIYCYLECYEHTCDTLES